MPLRKSARDEDVAYNIRELTKANKDKPKGEKRPHKQIVAIAMETKRRAEKK